MGDAKIEKEGVQYQCKPQRLRFRPIKGTFKTRTRGRCVGEQAKTNLDCYIPPPCVPTVFVHPSTTGLPPCGESKDAEACAIGNLQIDGKKYNNFKCQWCESSNQCLPVLVDMSESIKEF